MDITNEGGTEVAPINAFAAVKKAFLRHRYRLIPCEPGTKKPAYPTEDGTWRNYSGWQNAGELSEANLEALRSQKGASMAVVLGIHPKLPDDERFVCLDFDVSQAGLKAALGGPVDQVLGGKERSVWRYGASAKMGAAFLRVKLPDAAMKLTKRTVAFGGSEKVELLAEGQKAMLGGMHPDGHAYRWRSLKRRVPDMPVSDVPLLTLGQLEAFLDRLAEEGKRAGFTVEGLGSKASKPGVSEAEFPALDMASAKLLQAALGRARNDVPREKWVMLCKAYRACCEQALGSDVVVEDLSDFDGRYVYGTDGGKTLAEVLAERELPRGFGLWQLVSVLAERLPDAEAKALLSMQRQVSARQDFCGEIDMDAVDRIMRDAVAAAGPAGQEVVVFSAITPKPLSDLLAGGLASLPPRRWEVKGLIMRGALTVVGGAGGTGKSSAMNAIALSVAAGLPFMGFDLRNPNGEPVLILNGDDDEAEISRRFGAMVQHYGIPATVLGRVHVLGSNVLGGMKACSVEGREIRFNESWFAWFRETVRKSGARFVAVDPLFALASLDENDNGMMGAFAGRLNRLAAELDIALVLVVHANKGGIALAAQNGGDRGANLIAGARRLIDAARAAFVIDALSEADAKHVGLSETDPRLKQMLGLWGVKGNYVARGAARAYFTMVAVCLQNARGLDDADMVGVPVPYKVPKVAATDSLLLAILDLIEAGTVKGAYSLTKRGGSDRCILPAIAGAVDWEAEGLEAAPSEDSLKDILKTRVLGPKLAEEKEGLSIRHPSGARDGKGLVLTAAGKAERDRLKAEAGHDGVPETPFG